MNSRFEILFDLRFNHGYFDNQVVDCFNVLPDGATTRYLRNNDLIYKSKVNGFDLLFESESNGITRKREAVLKEKQQLRFVVKLQDTLFYNYTALAPFDISDSVFHFKKVYHGENTSVGRLHEVEYVSEANIEKFEESNDGSLLKPFALIDIRLDSIESAKRLEISFCEKSTYWRYLIVSDHLRNIDKPAIINGNVTFKGPSKVMLPGNMEAIEFISEQPIGLHKRIVKKNQLLENYDSATQKGKVVLKALPVPDINIISAATRDINIELSEIVI